jgi:hypothetical protein
LLKLNDKPKGELSMKKLIALTVVTLSTQLAFADDAKTTAPSAAIAPAPKAEKVAKKMKKKHKKAEKAESSEQK